MLPRGAFDFGARSQASISTLVLPPEGLDFEKDVERRFVEEALIAAGGNHGKAAKLLGMNRDQIRYRIKKFGLKFPVS
ncbi:MAG: helix-turn-helix domain-containing protein [Planctomycetota bacterium]